MVSLSLIFNKKPHKGGTIVYGSPYYLESKLEQVLGRYIGNDWNIVACKPINNQLKNQVR